MLMEGDGCERDLAEAKDWLRRSVAGGYAHARELLAHLESLAEGGPAA
jgi:TPR repeat protein